MCGKVNTECSEDSPTIPIDCVLLDSDDEIFATVYRMRHKIVIIISEDKRISLNNRRITIHSTHHPEMVGETSENQDHVSRVSVAVSRVLVAPA